MATTISGHGVLATMPRRAPWFTGVRSCDGLTKSRRGTNDAKTATMITAAAVTTRALAENPCLTAACASR